MPRCTCCNSDVPNVNDISGEDHICDDCLEMYFSKCDECGEYYSDDVEFYATVDDRLVCEYCAQDMDPEEL